ncbi:MAG: DUF3369 protein [Magnetococcales bacterium]|nr:DUF3369 protein [Magnetococcales bacterium]
MTDEKLVYANEIDEKTTETLQKSPWTILIVDDEPGVHSVTRFALEGMRFEDREIEMISAFSAEEGMEKLTHHPETALVLLDVVMERENSGLEMVKKLRSQPNLQALRIILRTGQPGEAPERDVIAGLDINDYKSKNELTSVKLFTSVVSALRSYRDINRIEYHLRGLERVYQASIQLFGLQTLVELGARALEQLHLILEIEADDAAESISSAIFTAPSGDPRMVVLAGTGQYRNDAGRISQDVVDPETYEKLVKLKKLKNNLSTGDEYVTILSSNCGFDTLVFIRHQGQISDINKKKLLDIYLANISIAFDNAHLFDQLKKVHQTAIQSLVTLMESGNADKGKHLRQVEYLSTGIAQYLLDKGLYPEELNSQFIMQLGMASVLHDVGNAAVPQEIMGKREKLNEDEWRKIREHVHTGSKVLRDVSQRAQGINHLSMAVEIALFHHERYDGSGYHGLTGRDIPMSARIMAVVDVYTALVSVRPHREPMPHKQAVEYIRTTSGTQFDPDVVDAFINLVNNESQFQKLL